MNILKPVENKEAGHSVRNVLRFFVFATPAIASFPLLQRFYFVQELLFFVGLALLVTFLLVNLLILGLLFRRVGRFILHNIPRANTSLTTRPISLIESHSNSILTTPPITTEADSGSA